MIYFVNIALKLELPINVRCYFDSSKARGEGNFVIFIYRKILLVPEDARICFTVSLFLTTTKDFSEIQSSILLIMIIYVILVFILIFEN